MGCEVLLEGGLRGLSLLSAVDGAAQTPHRNRLAGQLAQKAAMPKCWCLGTARWLHTGGEGGMVFS